MKTVCVCVCVAQIVCEGAAKMAEWGDRPNPTSPPLKKTPKPQISAEQHWMKKPRTYQKRFPKDIENPRAFGFKGQWGFGSLHRTRGSRDFGLKAH